MVIVNGAAHAREWASTDGAKLDAEFISSDEAEVSLKRRSDGKTFTLPLSRLSEDDQTWIKGELTKAAEPAATAAPVTGQYAKRITGQWDLSRFGKLPYAIYGGKDLDGAKKYPLLIALHGKSANDVNGVQIPALGEGLCRRGELFEAPVTSSYPRYATNRSATLVAVGTGSHLPSRRCASSRI